MITIHIQRIRSCVQCKKPLPLKCSACMEHPDRKPQIIILYDFPSILATAECGCCVKIKCQREGCSNIMWRYVKSHYRNGKWPAKTFCCGVQCAALAASLSRKSSLIKTECHYCGKAKEVKPYNFKMSRFIYCNQECHYLDVRKMNIESRQKRKESKNMALLACLNGCSGQNGDKITEHSFVTGSYEKYRCNDCGHVRPAGALNVH